MTFLGWRFGHPADDPGRPGVARCRRGHTAAAPARWSKLAAVSDVGWLFAMGVLAGVVSVVASLASLISYPALLAVGLPPLAANVTNTTALVFVGLGSAAGSRRELAGQRPTGWSGSACSTRSAAAPARRCCC